MQFLLSVNFIFIAMALKLNIFAMKITYFLHDSKMFHQGRTDTCLAFVHKEFLHIISFFPHANILRCILSSFHIKQ